jgi:hypothetical protein
MIAVLASVLACAGLSGLKFLICDCFFDCYQWCQSPIIFGDLGRERVTYSWTASSGLNQFRVVGYFELPDKTKVSSYPKLTCGKPKSGGQKERRRLFERLK